MRSYGTNVKMKLVNPTFYYPNGYGISETITLDITQLLFCDAKRRYVSTVTLVVQKRSSE